MAKYCRYCREKMSHPKDRFCYKCRREGSAVDRFYRKIPEEYKASLTEDEQDALRSEGIETVLCAVIIVISVLPLLYMDIACYLYGAGWQFPLFARTVLILIVILSARIGIMGLQLFMLNKKAFRKKSNIILYKVFFSFMHIRSRSGSVFHMVVTLPKGLKEVDKFASLIEKLAYGEKIEAAPQRDEHTDDDSWECGFCGYVNTDSIYSCKSCGKEKIERK